MLNFYFCKCEFPNCSSDIFFFLIFFFGLDSMMEKQSNVPSMMRWWSWPLSVLSVMIPRWTSMRFAVLMVLDP